MRENKEKKAGILILALLLSFLSGFLFFGEKEEYSYAERRKLEDMDKITAGALFDGSYTEGLETYVTDHFPFRQFFRGVKTFFSACIFGTKEVNGLYEENGFLVKRQYPLEEESISYGIDKFNYIYDTYLKDQGSKCYFAVIPDKDYFFGEDKKILSLDYDRLFRIIKEKITFADILNIALYLKGEDYYKTDTHWRQERLLPVAEYLAKSMGAEISLEFDEKKAESQFFGVYSGQWALPHQPDELIYLTNDCLSRAKLYNIGEKGRTEAKIYNTDVEKGKDPYDLFMSGASPIQILENNDREEGRELIIFRDSFGSSLSPLLLSGYKSITLIDIRYIKSDLLDHYVDFRGQDVLFLYSTLILNQSRSLR